MTLSSTCNIDYKFRVPLWPRIVHVFAHMILIQWRNLLIKLDKREPYSSCIIQLSLTTLVYITLLTASTQIPSMTCYNFGSTKIRTCCLYFGKNTRRRVTLVNSWKCIQDGGRINLLYPRASTQIRSQKKNKIKIILFKWLIYSKLYCDNGRVSWPWHKRRTICWV